MTKALETAMHAINPRHSAGTPPAPDPTGPGKPPTPKVDPGKAPPENPDRDFPGTPGFPAEDPGRPKPVDDPPPANPDGVPPPPGGTPEIRE